jgi:uncharacterized membrane protein YdjX (TVP38/TMEM64 family)
MIAADTYKRLRLVYPAASRSRDVATFVHSKVMVVDDTLARIGSANFSHRSMGMDTECDLAAEAGDGPEARAGVRRVRDRLLAEHLDLPVDDVARGIERAGSMGGFIDTRQTADHTLVRLDLSQEIGSPPAVLHAAADPDEPAAFGSAVETLVPAFDATSAHNPLRLWILPVVTLAAALAIAFRSSHTLDSMAITPSSLWVGAALFVVAGLLLVPLELLAVVAGVCFGALRGGVVAMIGSLAAAVIGYAAGRMIGAEGLTRWISRQSYRSVRQVSARGAGGVAALRLSSIASAGSIHLLCGAGRVPFVSYLAGTIIGSIPVVAALCWLGGLLRQTLLYPSPSTGLATVGAAVLLFVLVSVLRTLLLIRQFAPAVSSQRDRSEFG